MLLPDKTNNKQLAPTAQEVLLFLNFTSFRQICCFPKFLVIDERPEGNWTPNIPSLAGTWVFPYYSQRQCCTPVFTKHCWVSRLISRCPRNIEGSNPVLGALPEGATTCHICRCALLLTVRLACFFSGMAVKLSGHWDGQALVRWAGNSPGQALSSWFPVGQQTIWRFWRCRRSFGYISAVQEHRMGGKPPSLLKLRVIIN